MNSKCRGDNQTSLCIDDCFNEGTCKLDNERHLSAVEPGELTMTSEYHCGNCPEKECWMHPIHEEEIMVGKNALVDPQDFCAVHDHTFLRGCLSHPSAQAALRAEGAKQERERTCICNFDVLSIGVNEGTLKHLCERTSCIHINEPRVLCKVESRPTLSLRQSQNTGAQQEEQG